MAETGYAKPSPDRTRVHQNGNPGARHDCGVDYRLAATEITRDRDRDRCLVASGTLHAHLNGVARTVCGLSLGLEVIMFPDARWDDRPSGVPACGVCRACDLTAPQ
jgi:hypothetical protein